LDLLDNQSTIDVFQNRRLLKSIRDTGKTLKIHCNVGITSASLVGSLAGYGKVWFHPKGIAYILSLSKVNDRYRGTVGSKNWNELVVHKNNGAIQIFSESKQ